MQCCILTSHERCPGPGQSFTLCKAVSLPVTKDVKLKYQARRCDRQRPRLEEPAGEQRATGHTSGQRHKLRRTRSWREQFVITILDPRSIAHICRRRVNASVGVSRRVRRIVQPMFRLASDAARGCGSSRSAMEPCVVL